MKPIRTLIVPVIIAALTVTGIATSQAKAANEDLAKIVAGAVVLGVIANALDKSDKATVTARSGSGYDGWVYDDRRHDGDRYRGSRYARALDPECLMTYRARHGARELYEGRCLKRTNRQLADLPKHCAVRVVVRGGKNRVAYEPRCLRRAGFWEVGKRRHAPVYDGNVWEDRFGSGSGSRDDRRDGSRDGHIRY